MNEEIEYAEMLEIPVSTVNVVHKKRAKRRKIETPPFTASKFPDLKDTVIAQVNDKLNENGAQEQKITADAELFAESANSEGSVRFDDVPQRIDTVRLYSAHDRFDKERLYPEDYPLAEENEGGRYAFNQLSKKEKTIKIVLGTQFALACALCGTIFLTNVFMPNSAINTFFRALNETPTIAQTDDRTYTDFTLSSVVSELSDAQLTLSPTGILSFTDACCVYPAANGKVSAVTANANGTYTLKISYSDSFTGIIEGLNSVYYEVGQEVKTHVPVGYTTGETAVQVTMYSEGALLNCFQLTEENCLAWVTQPYHAQ